MTPQGDNNVCPVDEATLDILRELADEDTPDFFSDLLESFLQDATRLGNELGQAVAAQDLELVARISHTLKSSSGNIGATKLAGLCADLESRARTDRSLNQAEESSTKISAELTSVTTYLRSLL